MKKLLSGIALFFTVSSGAHAADLFEKSEQVQRLYQENIATFAIGYAAAARSQDYQKVLRLSCMQLGLTVAYIDPASYRKDGKEEEIAALKERATSLHEQLKSQGYCE